ncbi:MAG: hypothetical protein A2X67_09770 [Ignavibacteria bacterium GWA2_55_11]|nr:MAG: hypothetical protein A2X67_09770 [Ignavibacteria bacterium GWA2_55_11]
MQSKLKFLAASLIAASVLTTFASCKGGGGATLVRVGREAITQGDLDTLARVNPRLKPRIETPAGRQKVIENYVEQEILYQESVNRGLNRSTDVKDKIALYEKILVAQALLDEELSKKVHEYYDTHKDEFDRVKVSHILIKASSPNEPEPAAGKDKKKEPPAATSKRPEADALKLAESIRDRVNKGDDFTKVAKEVSEDEKSKANGGDIGYITLSDKRLERLGWLPLAEKSFAMKVGEVSQPIKLKDGFHIVKVTEEKKLQPFDEAEAGIKFRLQADIRTGLLDGLKKKYKVEYAKSETPSATERTTAPSPHAGAAGAPAASDAAPAVAPIVPGGPDAAAAPPPATNQ